ncbi:MAG: hypothetical protein WBF89_19895 [Steroidobacteraceae bacterium]
MLACFGLSLIALARLHPADDLTMDFALYGALHASALIFALRARLPMGRACAFILMAAALSAMTLRVGLFVAQSLGTTRLDAVLYTVLGFSAAAGAAAYGILIRVSGIYTLLSARALAMASIGCLLAAPAALFSMTHLPVLGRWWLAMLWWYAFSGSLWYADDRPRSAAPESGAASH